MNAWPFAYRPRTCGRFTYKLTWAEIVKLYRLPLDLPARNTQPNYNVCLTDPIDVVSEREGKREAHLDALGAPALLVVEATQGVAARDQAVTTKPFFREPFKTRRCLIPASGYYEWHDTSHGSPAKPAAGRSSRRRTTCRSDGPVSNRVNSSKAPQDDVTLMDEIELTASN